MQQDEFENEIQAKGLTAPRVTPADLESAIASTWYINAGTGVVPDDYQPPVPVNHPLNLLTICVLILNNGHRIVGVNEGPVSPANFDAEIGRKIARQKAVSQLWQLLGFSLKERLHNEATAKQQPAPGAATTGYSAMQPHQQRVADERAELIDKLTKLGNFFSMPIFAGLPADEQERLRSQHTAMQTYAEILGARILAF